MRELEASGLDISTEIQVHRGVEALPLLRGDLWSCPSTRVRLCGVPMGSVPRLSRRSRLQGFASPRRSTILRRSDSIPPCARPRTDGVVLRFPRPSPQSTSALRPSSPACPSPFGSAWPGVFCPDLARLQRFDAQSRVDATGRARSDRGGFGARRRCGTGSITGRGEPRRSRRQARDAPRRGAGWLGPGKLSAGGRGPPWRFRCTAGARASAMFSSREIVG